MNLQGKVIAVNSAIARIPGSGALGTQSGNIGLGFAIPSQPGAPHRRGADPTPGKASHPIIGVLLDRGYTGEGVRVASEAQAGQPPVPPRAARPTRRASSRATSSPSSTGGR